MIEFIISFVAWLLFAALCLAALAALMLFGSMGAGTHGKPAPTGPPPKHVLKDDDWTAPECYHPSDTVNDA